MKFYIDGKIVTSKEMPLVAILSKKDKENIANMEPKAKFYCEFDTDTRTRGEISDLLKQAGESLWKDFGER